MGVFRQPLNDGTPNEKPYVLTFPDGEVYVQRHRGESRREFSLEEAVSVANWAADEGETLTVRDPETQAALWNGTRSMR